MLLVTDLKSDLSDDIYINGDIQIDDSISNSVMNIVERRLIARSTDFAIDDIAAALETFLFKPKTEVTNVNIRTSITNCLLKDRLLQPSDFSIDIVETGTKRMYISIKFKNQMIEDSNSFRIIVDIENQKIYRG